MHPTIPDGRYGEATEHVRAAYARVRAMTADSFFNPCRDTSVAEAIIARWLAKMVVLVNDGAAERAVARVTGEPGAQFMAFLRMKWPPPIVPSSVEIEWAEGPWELLVAPDPPEEPDDLEPWGGWVPGGWMTDLTLRRWLDSLLMYHLPLQVSVGPPVWQGGPHAHERLVRLSRGLPAVDVAGYSGRAGVALAKLSSSLRFIADEFLAFSLAEPIFGANPNAWWMAMCEHGLIPLGCDAERLYVFRYNPKPIRTPAWLVGLHGRSPPPGFGAPRR